MATLDLLPAELTPANPAPRTALIGASFAAAGATVLVGSLLAMYVDFRANALSSDQEWFGSGVKLELAQPNMMMFTLVLSLFTVAWSIYSANNADRQNAYVGLGLSLLLGAAMINQTIFYYAQSGVEVATPAGLLFYAVTATHLLVVGLSCGLLALSTFRALAGQVGPGDRAGLSGAAVLWSAMVLLYCVIWYVIYVAK